MVRVLPGRCTLEVLASSVDVVPTPQKLGESPVRPRVVWGDAQRFGI
jgi:hypothetical protein